MGGFCKSWRAPAACCLAVAPPPVSAGRVSPVRPSAVILDSCASNDDPTFQAGCNDGSVKASASARMSALLPLTGAPTFQYSQAGWHENIVWLDFRFVETGWREAPGVFR